MGRRNLKDIWEQGERRHIALSSRSVGSRIPIWICFALLLPIAIASFVASGSYIEGNVLFLVALALIWGIGTGWIFAGLAADAGGWSNLDISTLIVLPLATLIVILGPIFAFALYGLGHMH